MELSTIPLTFSFGAGVRADIYERFPFWNLPSTIEWFKKRGYTLYECIKETTSKPALPCEVDCEAQYPFAHSDGEVYYSGKEQFDVPLLAVEGTGKMVFAQDSSNRHVVIKVLHANSDEYRIMKFLNEQRLETLEENCVLPILDLLENGDYWFAVMPRWGGFIAQFTRLYEVIDLMHCLLKGLVFLHKNNIVHGDIAGLNNVVANHFSHHYMIYKSKKQKELRLNRRLSYAIIDYDLSHMLPSRDSRLWYLFANGSWNQTGDTEAGEFDYDPFALDVGGMGVAFRIQFEHLTCLFPAFAPLFDMMMTWDVRRRFTASQALEFFEENLSEMTEEQLAADISNLKTVTVSNYDRWQHLSPDLVERWNMYRETPVPWTRKLLCEVTSWRYFWHIVPWVRWCCFQLFSEIPRQCFRWFFPSKFPF